MNKLFSFLLAICLMCSLAALGKFSTSIAQPISEDARLENVNAEIRLREIEGIMVREITPVLESHVDEFASPGQLLKLYKPEFQNDQEAITFLFSNQEPFRVVPGFPEVEDNLFSQPNYLPFINARVRCANAAENYQSLFSASAFERECLTQEIPNEIKAVTGLLATVDGYRPFCGATLIAPKFIITARHCFYNEDGTDNPRVDLIAQSNIKFVLAVPRGGFREFKILGTSLNQLDGKKVNLDNDFLVLKLERDIGRPFANLIQKAQRPDAPSGLWLFGPYPTYTMAQRTHTLVDFMQGSKPKLCAVVYYDKNNQCVYHSCQTTASTSGSGLLELTTSGVNLIATHSGSSFADAPCDGDEHRSALIALNPDGTNANKGLNVATFIHKQEIEQWILSALD